MSYYGNRRYNPPQDVYDASTVVGPFTGELAAICKKVAAKVQREDALKACDADPLYWQRQQLLAAEGRTHATLAEWIAT